MASGLLHSQVVVSLESRVESTSPSRADDTAETVANARRTIRSAWRSDRPEAILAGAVASHSNGAAVILGNRVGDRTIRLAAAPDPALGDVVAPSASAWRDTADLLSEVANAAVDLSVLARIVPDELEDLGRLASPDVRALALAHLAHAAHPVGFALWAHADPDPRDAPPRGVEDSLGPTAEILYLRGVLDCRPLDRDTWAVLLDLLPGPAFLLAGHGALLLQNTAARLAHAVQPPWCRDPPRDLPPTVTVTRRTIGGHDLLLLEEDPTAANVVIEHAPWVERWGLSTLAARVCAHHLVGAPPDVIAGRLAEPRARVERLIADLHARAGVRDREGLVRTFGGQLRLAAVQH